MADMSREEWEDIIVRCQKNVARLLRMINAQKASGDVVPSIGPMISIDDLKRGMSLTEEIIAKAKAGDFDAVKKLQTEIDCLMGAHDANN